MAGLLFSCYAITLTVHKPRTGGLWTEQASYLTYLHPASLGSIMQQKYLLKNKRS